MKNPTEFKPKTKSNFTLNYEENSIKLDRIYVNMKIKSEDYNWSGDIDIDRVGLQ
jgi:hypothetical protein